MAESRGVSVRQLLAAHDSRELSEWQAYYSLFAMPQDRDDLRTGTIAAIQYNTWKASSEAPRSAADFAWTIETAVAAEDARSQEERVIMTKQAMNMLRGPA